MQEHLRNMNPEELENKARFQEAMRLHEQGLVMDLTDVVNNSPYAADYKQDYFTPFKDGDGKIYGLPVLTGGTCTVVVYDKQMWKDAGYDSFPAT